MYARWCIFALLLIGSACNDSIGAPPDVDPGGETGGAGIGQGGSGGHVGGSGGGDAGGGGASQRQDTLVQETPSRALLIACGGNTLYWVLEGTGDLMRSSLDGSNAELMLAKIARGAGFLWVAGDTVYMKMTGIVRAVDTKTLTVVDNYVTGAIYAAFASDGLYWYDGERVYGPGGELPDLLHVMAMYGDGDYVYVVDASGAVMRIANGVAEHVGMGGTSVSPYGLSVSEHSPVWGSELGLHWVTADGEQKTITGNATLVAAGDGSAIWVSDGSVVTSNLGTMSAHEHDTQSRVLSVAVCNNTAFWSDGDGRIFAAAAD